MIFLGGLKKCLKPGIPEMTSGIAWQNWAAKRAVASATNKNQQDQ